MKKYYKIIFHSSSQLLAAWSLAFIAWVKSQCVGLPAVSLGKTTHQPLTIYLREKQQRYGEKQLSKSSLVLSPWKALHKIVALTAVIVVINGNTMIVFVVLGVTLLQS